MKTNEEWVKEKRIKIRGNIVEKGFIAPMYISKLIELQADT